MGELYRARDITPSPSRHNTFEFDCWRLIELATSQSTPNHPFPSHRIARQQRLSMI